MRVLEERSKKLADGLAFSEQAKHKLAQAETDSKKYITTAQTEAKSILDQARQRASVLVDNAKAQAKEEAQRIKIAAQKDIEQEMMHTKELLRKQLASLVVMGASKIINECVDEAQHNQLIDQLAANL